MGCTISEKIIALHAGLDFVRPGQIVNAKVDVVYGNDVTGALAISQMRRSGREKVFDPERIFLSPIHFGPAKDIRSAHQISQLRTFCREQGISHYYEPGKMGIDNVFLVEQGFIVPGDLTVGGDSHATMGGAVGAFSVGMGSTDIAAIFIRGETWLRVPGTVRAELKGYLGSWATPMDVMLHLIGQIGVAGALYKSLEFTGTAMSGLSIDDRMTLCNMAVEAGAKNAIVSPDDVTVSYISGRAQRAFQVLSSDPDAEYEKDLSLELGSIVPTVAKPSSPGNAAPASELGHVQIDQVVIGSCTNGKLTDLRRAATLLRGRRVASGVRVLVFPATQEIYLGALREGLIEVFVEAGCAVSTPTCGPCAGFQMGVLDAEDVCVSTTPRNFVGRMGHENSQVYLSSPYVAAASAVTGVITDPREIG